MNHPLAEGVVVKAHLHPSLLQVLDQAFPHDEPFRNHSPQLVQARAGEWEVGPVDDGGQEAHKELLGNWDEGQQPHVIEQ